MRWAEILYAVAGGAMSCATIWCASLVFLAVMIVYQFDTRLCTLGLQRKLL